MREIASERATERYYLETETDMERERERERETSNVCDRETYRQRYI